MYDEHVFEAVDVSEALTELLALDVTTATDVQLGAACRRARQIRGFLDAFEAAAARRSDELQAAGCGRGAETMLTRNQRVSSRHARQAIRRGEVLEEAPAIGAALTVGAVSAGHVDAYASVARSASSHGRAALVERQQSLALRATTESPEEFAVSCRRVVAMADDDGGISEQEQQRRATRLRRWIDESTGMYRLGGALDPELGVRIWRAIDHTVATNYPDGYHPDSTPDGPEAYDHLAALALADLIGAAYQDDHDGRLHHTGDQDDNHSGGDTRRADSGGGERGVLPRPPRGEFTVVIDYQTLIDGLNEHSIIEVDPGGITLPVAALRRLACEADLLPVVLDGHGVVLDVGRSKRLATADQRRGLRAMYASCAIAACGIEFDRCEIHHLDPFGGTDGTGQTNLDLLLPLCSRHHHAAHEGRWQLHLDPTSRMLSVTLPDGTTDTRPPPRARRPAA